jgi:hypothetical protein
MTLRGPLGRFVLKVLAWLPATFLAWYLAAPVLVWPVYGLLRLITAATLPDLVRGIEQAGAVFTFATTLRAGLAGGIAGVVTVDVDALLYAFGMPLFAALALAAAEPRRARTLALGYAVLVPVVTWGVLADFLRNVAITSGPLVASQTGFSAGQREAIAFAYQFGALVLPTVVPAMTWVITHRRFLERMRQAPLR